MENTAQIDIMEEICEAKKLQLSCGKITPHDAMFNGSHRYFKIPDNTSFISFVKENMRVGYVYEKEAFGEMDGKF